MSIETVETARLIIRPLRMEDLESCHRLSVDVGWADAALSDDDNRERKRTWLDWTIAGYREFGRLHQPVYGERAIETKADGSFIGMIGFVPSMVAMGQLTGFGERQGAPQQPEPGLFWAVSPAAQSCGYASEAAAAFMAAIMAQYGMARMVATTEHDNARSIAVMRRIGMRIERNPYPHPPYLQVVGVYETPSGGSVRAR
jgi:RimJ/RimL family protein N-acetyltransferase